MSRHKPIVRERGNQIEYEVDTGSITPTTHQERNFESTKDAPYFEDIYSSPRGIHVTRFGLNPISNKKNVTTDLVEDASTSTLAAAIPIGVVETAAPLKKAVKPDTSASSTQGSGSTKRDLFENCSKTIIHEPEELEVLKKAIERLFFSDSTLTVLVDIYERDESSFELKGKDKTHTVVLYKNPIISGEKHLVTVIDPNNFGYSLHLGNNEANQYASHLKLEKIIAFYDKKRIYDNYGKKTEYAADAHRNCVDVAVKIAFNLNFYEVFRQEKYSKGSASAASSEQSHILPPLLDSLDKILTAPEILAIENTGLQQIWHKTKIPVRIRQDSDPYLSYSFYEIAKALEINLKLRSVTSLQDAKIFEKKLLDSLAKFYDKSSILKLKQEYLSLHSIIQKDFTCEVDYIRPILGNEEKLSQEGIDE